MFYCMFLLTVKSWTGDPLCVCTHKEQMFGHLRIKVSLRTWERGHPDLWPVVLAFCLDRTHCEGLQDALWKARESSWSHMLMSLKCPFFLSLGLAPGGGSRLPSSSGLPLLYLCPSLLLSFSLPVSPQSSHSMAHYSRKKGWSSFPSGGSQISANSMTSFNRGTDK